MLKAHNISEKQPIKFFHKPILRSWLKIAVVIIVITATIYLSASSIYKDSVVKLEAENIHQDMDRIVDAINNQLNLLQIVAIDYAVWDETYDFARNLNKNFLDNNFPPEIMKNLNLNFVLVVDLKKNIIGKTFYNLEKNSLHFISKIIDKKNKDKIEFVNHTGSFYTPDGLVLYAASPIFNSDKEGSFNGIIQMGNLLDKEELEKIAQITNINFEIKSIAEVNLTNNFVSKLLENPQGRGLKKVSDNLAYGYQLIRDERGDVIAVIKIINDRPIYRNGLAGLAYLENCLLMVAIIFIAMSKKFIHNLEGEIKKRHQIEKIRKKEQQLAYTTFDSIIDGVILTDAEKRIVFINPVAEELTDWQAYQAVGQPLEQVYQVIQAKTANITKQKQLLNWQDDKDLVDLIGDKILISRRGTQYSVDESMATIRENGELSGCVVVFRDVSKSRQMAYELAWQANYDSLTKLLNRRAFETHLDKTLTQVKEAQGTHCLALIDLDHFKYVNDTCGHPVGDELLKQVSQIFKEIIPTTHTIARLGGDEFGIIFSNCSLPLALSFTQKLCEAIQDYRFYWQNQVFRVGISIGLTAITQETKKIDTLFIEADLACYAAKQNGRGRVEVYCRENPLPQRLELQWVGKIHQALIQNRFCLFYQPIISLKNDHPQGEHYEVLLRLKDESGNLLSPGMFLPVAERYDLMPTLDRWVIQTLFSTQKQHYNSMWERACAENFECLYSINLSGSSLNDEQFIDFVYDELQNHQIPPQVICFEITETVAITNLNKTINFIKRLKALGCKFALDDFGTGMSSFNYLKKMPVDYLKIDGCFIEEILEDAIAYSMVKVINEIAHLMGIKTVAEFVKNKGILEKVNSLNIDYGQGYFIAEPRPLCVNQENSKVDQQDSIFQPTLKNLLS